MTHHPDFLKIGLTGGIGSGKSTVAQMLGERGAAIVDADAISRTVTACGGSAIEKIMKTFGNEFVTPEGALNRERMRQHIFSTPTAKQALEAIIHPLVTEESDRLMQEAIHQGKRTVVFDVPLLVESGSRWRRKVDRVLLVDCHIDTQVQRVLDRSQLDEGTIRRIIDSQATRSSRLAASDWVIHNEGIQLEKLRALVGELPIAAT